MKITLHTLACASTVSIAAVAPAAPYNHPGTRTMLLQMFGAAIAGAIFYFRELRLKLLSLFTRRGTAAADDASEPPPGDAPR
jgi:hypothetical protein